MKVKRYEVQGTLMSYPREQDWTTILRTDDPVRATTVVHETEGTFWRRPSGPPQPLQHLGSGSPEVL
ncbi:hypothetical protein ADL27_52170 [Streptomyces sp. NRRL F-6602]|nr:hypothetical protein ADL27_52170 [Streptomyces sp. NRRL F-6602]